MTRLEQPTETEGDEPFENFKMPYEGLASNEFIENEEPQMDESDEPNEDLSNNSKLKVRKFIKLLYNEKSFIWCRQPPCRSH